METKKCGKCGVSKDISLFSKKRKVKSGLNHWCKDCHKIYKDRHYEQNAEYYKLKNKKAKAQIRQFMLELKQQLSCTVCGENHIATLDFHHPEPEQKEIPLAQYKNYGIPRIMSEIEKCVVMCSNCHRKLHYEEKMKKQASKDEV